MSLAKPKAARPGRWRDKRYSISNQHAVYMGLEAPPNSKRPIQAVLLPSIIRRYSPVRMNPYRSGSFGYIRCACYLDGRCVDMYIKRYLLSSPRMMEPSGIDPVSAISGFASATLVEVGLMPHNTVNRRRPPALAWVRALHTADEFRGCGPPRTYPVRR